MNFRTHIKGFPFETGAGTPLCSPHSAFATVHQRTKCFLNSLPIYDGERAQSVSDVVVAGCVFRRVGFCGLHLPDCVFFNRHNEFVTWCCTSFRCNLHMPCIFMDVANAVFRARRKTFRCFAAFCVKRQHCIANESCQEHYSARCACVLHNDIVQCSSDLFLFVLAETWKNSSAIGKHCSRLGKLRSVIVTWLCGMLECDWQSGLRFTPSFCGCSSWHAQCLAGVGCIMCGKRSKLGAGCIVCGVVGRGWFWWRFVWRKNVAVVLMVAFVVLLWWFRWSRFAV